MHMASAMINFPLNTGKSIPAIGLGSVLLEGDQSLVVDSVLHAIKVGYRHFDTATIYGTEGALGEALAEAFRSGLVSREEAFITSKLWNTDHEPEDVLPAVQKSLSLLQLDYIDLYLIHWPLRFKKGVAIPPKGDDDFLPIDIKATWQALEKCVEKGLVHAIGVSNFSVEKLTSLLDYAKIVPSVNQVERHPVWQQKKLKPFCDAKGIHVSGWSPLGAPGAVYGTQSVIKNPVLQSIAEKRGKTPAQVALRWGVQTGASVLPKSFNPKRIAENFDIFSWELSEDDITQISKIEQRRSFPCDSFAIPRKILRTQKNYGMETSKACRMPKSTQEDHNSLLLFRNMELLNAFLFILVSRRIGKRSLHTTNMQKAPLLRRLGFQVPN